MAISNGLAGPETSRECERRLRTLNAAGIPQTFKNNITGRSIMALVLDWQKKLGYRHDPFDMRIPQPVKQHIVGTYDLQERINLFLIKEEQFGTITGEHGTGKTMLLRWVEEELARHKTHTQQYIDARGKESLLGALSRRTLLQRVFKRSAKQPRDELLRRLAKERRVILIDNAGHMSADDLVLLADILSKTPTVALLADRDLRLPAFHDRLKATMPKYGAAELTEMLRRRIEAAGGRGTHPFDAAELERLIRKAENPAKLLQLARERAIELSLKATAPPAPAPVTAGKGLFSIKIEKGNKASDYEVAHRRTTPVQAGEAHGDPRTDAAAPKDPEKDIFQDADLLAQVVGTAAPARKKRPAKKR